MKPIIFFFLYPRSHPPNRRAGRSAQSPMGNALSFGGNAASQYVVVSNFGSIIPTNVTERSG